MEPQSLSLHHDVSIDRDTVEESTFEYPLPGMRAEHANFAPGATINVDLDEARVTFQYEDGAHGREAGYHPEIEIPTGEDARSVMRWVRPDERYQWERIAKLLAMELLRSYEPEAKHGYR